MYHGAARDRGDKVPLSVFPAPLFFPLSNRIIFPLSSLILNATTKKRQRLTPPPNEVWMEAIMNKGKTPAGYIPASAVTASGVVTSSAAAWQGERERLPTTLKRRDRWDLCSISTTLLPQATRGDR
ncbi:hypothetical protein GQ600_16142 [Phytophthora cactorum]|nr:hypothetical protein GQ600_16142 [Phytophthora cactorum]